MRRKKWSEIRDALPRERREANERAATRMHAEMMLADLRRAHEYTQTELAHRLGIRQASVSEMERKADMYVSTLRGFVRALGGELEITARFPDGEPVRIQQFEELEQREPAGDAAA